MLHARTEPELAGDNLSSSVIRTLPEILLNVARGGFCFFTIPPPSLMLHVLSFYNKEHIQ